MKWILTVVFAAVLLGHFLFVTGTPTVEEDTGPWATYQFDQPEESRLTRYIEPGQYWLGFSYALAGAFAFFSFARILRMRRDAIASSVGGLTLSAVLWAGVCFLTGCCGSPMLPLYLGLIGPRFLGVTKPLVFVVTLLSIAVGYAWMLRRAPKAIANNVNTGLHEAVGANSGQV